MAYLVELTLRAERDLEYLYQRISAAESVAAARWFNGLERANPGA
jgi:plasmid stabilization system protein ParE